MENYSPLRYPGGKSALYPAIANIIESNNMKHCIYIEPFAGGANIAWSLLINGIVDYIIINDADKSIYSFWRAITESTHWFIEKIESVSVTVDEWRKQRAILQESSRYSKELGFAMFFLNRTNRSGILDAGPIGGYDQSGTYKIDCRFNKASLIKKISKIAEYKKNVKIYNQDISVFLLHYLPRWSDKGEIFIYFDPPYYEKGQRLYMNYLSGEDHERLRDAVSSLDCKWEVQCLKPPYDWYEAISDEKWVKQIAYVTRLISEEEQNSVSVMWFVGVDKSQYNCDVFPWYHEHYEYNDNLSMPRNKLSFEDAIAIHTLQDLKNLEALTQTSASNIRNIQIQPTNANFLRDRDVIGRIGTVAKGLGASILLEGGILSHAYYQLIRTGAKVQVRYSFEKRQQFEFNKLVRDKIPEKIEKNGEEAVTAELNKELFSSLLKRKLVEEALEVLDSKNDEDIIAELADILEVLDGILSQYQIDFNTVLSQKEIKRKKSGGFDKGIYLKKTTSRTASGEGRIIVDKAPVDTKQGISKSTDWRRYPNANESLTRIKVPVTLDKWEVRPSVKSDNIDIVLRGERKQGVWQVEISVFEEADQLSFFDK